MSQQPPQPNLVVIGAQKSGTTSLYHYLNAHPQIFMSRPIKEPGYFMKTRSIVELFRNIRRPVESRRQVLERYMLKGYRLYAFLDLEPAGEARFKVHNLSDNRQDFEARSLLFPTAAYREAARLIRSDVVRLERFLQRSLAVWDLSMARWSGGEIRGSLPQGGE